MRGLIISLILPFVSGLVVWLTMRNCKSEARRKRGEILLVLAPFFAAALLFVGYLIFH